MRRRTPGVLIGLAVAGLAIGTTSVPAGASSRIDHSVAEPKIGTLRSDNLPNPLAAKSNALRQAAVDQLIRGTAKTVQKEGGPVIEVRPGQYVDMQAQRQESIFTMLVQFGKKIDHRGGGNPGPLTTRSRSRTGTGTATAPTTTRPTGRATSTSSITRT